MPVWFYRFFIALLAIELFAMLLYKIGTSPFEPPTRSAEIAITVLTYIAVPLFVMLLLHFVNARLWFFVIALLTQLALSFWVGIESELVWHSYRPDFSFLHFLHKLEFWAAILLALAGIYSDKGKLSWLSIYGLTLALHTSASYIFVPDFESKMYLLFIITSSIPRIIFVFYFLSVLEKSGEKAKSA